MEGRGSTRPSYHAQWASGGEESIAAGHPIGRLKRRETLRSALVGSATHAGGGARTDTRAVVAATA